MNEEFSELIYEDFVRARNSYWQQTAARNPGKGPAFLENDVTGTGAGGEGSDFMLYSPGPGSTFAVFEDSGKAGWFYLYGAEHRAILKSVPVYDRANVVVQEDVVDIGWAEDGSTCGLAVWGEFRAFLGVSKDLKIGKPVMDAEERGIPASDWPAGFDRYIEKKID